MSSQLTSFRIRYLLGLLAALAILLFVGAAVIQGLRTFISDANWETRTLDTIEQIGSIYTRIKDAEAAQRGFLLTANTDFLDQYELARQELPRRLEQLASILKGNPVQTTRVQHLAALTGQRVVVLQQVLNTFNLEGEAVARAKVSSNIGKRLMDEIAVLVEAMELEERNMLGQRRTASQKSSDLLQWIALFGIATSILLLCLLFVLILRENGVRLRAERRSEESSLALADKLMQLGRITESTNELRNYAGMLQSCRSIDEAMQITRRTLINVLPDWRGAVYLVRASHDFAEQQVSWGEHGADSTALIPLDDCWALRRGQLYCVPDLNQGNPCPHVAPSNLSAATSTLCEPLNAQGQTLGLLFLSAIERDASAAGLLAVSVAEQLSLALFNLRLQETLRLQSIRDPLTGLYNRRYLEESLTREIARCARRNTALTVMMFDFDHFKQFNDSHGHDGGDALLRSFAETLRLQCRGEDIPCRFGGEEFTLIMPEVDVRTASERAEQLRAAVESMRVMHLKQPLSQVTISIGIACMPQHGSTMDELIRSADSALYLAKHAGRNRVVVA